jgi:hypothetical protein
MVRISACPEAVTDLTNWLLEGNDVQSRNKENGRGRCSAELDVLVVVCVLPALAFSDAFELAQPVIPVKLLVSND